MGWMTGKNRWSIFDCLFFCVLIAIWAIQQAFERVTEATFWLLGKIEKLFKR